jgi:hypothetical protein
VNQFGLPKVTRLGLSQLLDGILVVYTITWSGRGSLAQGAHDGITYSFPA